MLCKILAWAGFGAKTLVDEGYHPMPVYFPLVVNGMALVEPTKSESEVSLDRFIAALAGFAKHERGDAAEFFHGPPHHTPRHILGEAAE